MLVVVAGLTSEARLAKRAGLRTIIGGGDAISLAANIDRAIVEGATALLSFGIAGGLRPRVAAGTLLVADRVVDGDQQIATDADWSRRLRTALPSAISGSIAGVDKPAATVADKRALHATSGAAAVDMESHIVARAAVKTGLPFAVLRAIADPADRSVPRAAIAGMRRDGSVDVVAVLRALARNPAELPTLLFIAVDSAKAFATLRKAALFTSPAGGSRRA